MFGGVTTEFRTRTFPPGASGHQLALHLICGGDNTEACDISVHVEEMSATSYSRTKTWSLPPTDKAIGSSALASGSWTHKIVDLPPSEENSQVTITAKHLYDSGGGVGLDNIVYTSNKKCNPRSDSNIQFST